MGIIKTDQQTISDPTVGVPSTFGSPDVPNAVDGYGYTTAPGFSFGGANAVDGYGYTTAPGFSFGGANDLSPPNGSSYTVAPGFGVGSATGTASGTDMRVRLSALNPDAVFKDELLGTLKATRGMLFPYTPQINFTQAVNYMDIQLVHSNTDYPAYTRTPSVTIGVSGRFTVQNQAEGRYALACLHFLRTVSKSYFGKLDADKAGLPPPILTLNGYGNYMFNNLRVILKSHNWTFDDTSDGIDVVSGSYTARLPSLFTITTELMVVQTPTRMREQFSFDKFASGELMKPGAGWI